ncbi:kinesin-related protein 11-like, partial [Xenia sp. Carnegie-2017]|uniref:kinesin-related protein 11-like n=1 Tax=Xenia sp. Carnegie-2017 TaxID=2897299 RepID=UPI001F04B90E
QLLPLIAESSPSSLHSCEPGEIGDAVKVSHLNLVDLAGSERASASGAEGLRLKEGSFINTSLFTLSDVIYKLSDGDGGFIPYRNSKLTRILQNSLGGNAKTSIICAITPASIDETHTTLQIKHQSSVLLRDCGGLIVIDYVLFDVRIFMVLDQ